MFRPEMSPEAGSHLVRYVGDRLAVQVGLPEGALPDGWRAFLRTNLTRGERAREEVVALGGQVGGEDATFAGASWRDIPMPRGERGWLLDLVLTETGPFRAKPFLVDGEGHQHWPEGPDLGVSVMPDHLRTGNTLYCAFPRMFGPARTRSRTPEEPPIVKALEGEGWTLIPPSGTLRDLTACVPHILEELGCRILHLLPVGPVPTTFARMGRFGSPYAQLDMEAVDPALVVFDRRTTGEDQFRELASAVHLRGGLLFLDIVINHTGWASRLMERRPEWFHRNPDGTFKSPGVWGVTWEDLVELDSTQPALWETVAQSLLAWCRRGVDGFRCDAGYMVPLPVWQYVIARVRQVYPDTTFLLEGLGGAWELTEALLTEGGMQWAYSELFQNHDPRQVAGYLDHALHQGGRMGPLVHYSETHDNSRLAAMGPVWSLMRNRLCALTSLSGAFGFTAGVEWLADEQIRVHGATGMAWGRTPNLVPDLAALNHLLRDHPCFFDGARLERLSGDDSPVLVLARHAADGQDRVLVVVNLDATAPQTYPFEAEAWLSLGRPRLDLLGQAPPEVEGLEGGGVRIHLAPGAAYCLADRDRPRGLHGETYRQRRAQAAWAFRHLAQAIPAEDIGPAPWQALAERVAADPAGFLASLSHLDRKAAREDLLGALAAAEALGAYPPVVRWSAKDLTRVVVVPPDHWLLVEEDAPFTLTLGREGRREVFLRSMPTGSGHVAAIFPRHLEPGDGGAAEARLVLARTTGHGRTDTGRLLLAPRREAPAPPVRQGLVLLTNGRGGMARIPADPFRVSSKYDCVLGTNLHPTEPCDRHVLVKRLRVWAVADGFISALDGRHLLEVVPGPPALWRFRVPAGDGRVVEVHLRAQMVQGRNTVHLRLSRHDRTGHPPVQDLRLVVRLDLEDRSFHMETQGGPEAEAHFAGHLSVMPDRAGFQFQPAPDRGVTAWMEGARWNPEPEWSWDIPHPVEGSRGMRDRGDAWSPGWFGRSLADGEAVDLVVTSEDPALALEPDPQVPDLPHRGEGFGQRLEQGARAFLARRGRGTTVIAGFPWFLDWGRDTLIACRGLLEAGEADAVADILLTYAHFEDRGTLPNMLAAGSLANRETSDAPLWFGLACEEAVARLGKDLLEARTEGGRKLIDVLENIAKSHLEGTPSGVRVDPRTGLVWSPSHHTWMDTNHPAGTPREGFPVELQALWVRNLRFLDRHGRAPRGDWDLRALEGIGAFWVEADGFFSDCLVADGHRPDGHLRPNMLFLVTLGLVHGERARRTVSAALRWLMVPGALRSLAPRGVQVPLPIRGRDGQLLNDPLHPYWGHYEGDEDTRRKPAYHNGTAWCWPLPTLAEAVACAWPDQSQALAAARSLLLTMQPLLDQGCLGHLPEILDGDAPHTPRGCDAQAWSATEALRVWRRLAHP